MAYTNIKTIGSVAGLVKYLQEDKKKQVVPRVLDMTTLNATAVNFVEEVQANMDSWNQSKRVTGFHVIISWSPEELTDPQKAMEIAEDFTAQMFPDRQAMIVIQNDGTNGVLHAHIVGANVSIVDGRCMPAGTRSHDHVMEIADKVVEDHNVRNLNKENARTQDNSLTYSEIALKNKGEYVWKEDLQKRIKKALHENTFESVEDFTEYMSAQGVDARIRGSKRTDSGKAMSYAFLDRDCKSRIIKAGKLGNAYTYEGLHESISIKYGQKVKADELEQKRLAELAQISSQEPQEPLRRAEPTAEVIEPKKEEKTLKTANKASKKDVPRSERRVPQSLLNKLDDIEFEQRQQRIRDGLEK